MFSRLPSGEIEFHELRPPESDDLEDIAFNVKQRVLHWLKRHELLKNEAEDGFSNESPELSALEASAQGSLGLGNLARTRVKLRNRRQHADENDLEQSAINGRVGVSHGYSLYAGKAISAEDKDGRERLLRYCLRASLSLERLSIGPDGNVIYQVKATRHGAETQRVMSPLQFMARLVALIPPPFHPLLRYFGVFGPHSSWRKSAVPEVDQAAEQSHEHVQPSAAPALKADSLGLSSTNSTSALAASDVLAPSSKKLIEAVGIKEKGPRFSALWRIDWATLLRRVHSVDALACPCGGRLRFVDIVTEPTTAQEILQCMGLPDELPPIARARSPDFYPERLPAEWD